MSFQAAALLVLFAQQADLCAALPGAPRKWAVMNDTNACPGSAASQPPISWPIHNVLTSADCASMCESNTTCAIFAWSTTGINICKPHAVRLHMSTQSEL